MKLGELGELQACAFLKKKGCKILEKNYRAGSCEIDIIARMGKIVLFVEVKTRTSSHFAEPWESVGFYKRKHLKTAAKTYVRDHYNKWDEYRFDVLSIVLKDEASTAEIEWMQNAF